MTDACADSTDEPYVTVTVLTFGDADHKSAVLDALRDLIDAVDELPGLEQVVVLETGPREACMITFYHSEAAAEQASARDRLHLSTVIGTHVTVPPRRWAGSVVIASVSPHSAETHRMRPETGRRARRPVSPVALPCVLHHRPPPTCSTPWPQTRPTAAPRSSNRSTPTSRAPRGRTSGKLTANAARLVVAVIAFNLTRAAAALTGAPALAKAATATIRRTLIHIPARVASCGPPPATART